MESCLDAFASSVVEPSMPPRDPPRFFVLFFTLCGKNCGGAKDWPPSRPLVAGRALAARTRGLGRATRATTGDIKGGALDSDSDRAARREAMGRRRGRQARANALRRETLGKGKQQAITL